MGASVLAALSAAVEPGAVAAESRSDLDEGSDLSAEERETVDMFERSRESVVHINTTFLERRGFQLGVEEVPGGSGTGFAWDAQHVVTNYHVIMGADTATVTLSDHSTYQAVVVGEEPDCDLAVLRIDRRTPLRALPLGRSSRLRVGQRVFAIGNPFGFDNTLTGGLVSGLSREMPGVSGKTIRGLVQTDAAINPGNSGGPLLNSKGELIGVNTMIASKTGSSIGLGFAIPSDTVARVVRQLIQFGRTKRPYLGVVPIAHPRPSSSTPGVIILHVEQDSPADKAGLRPTVQTRQGIVLGDEVIAVEGKRVTHPEELAEAVESHKIGEHVRLTIRKGTTVDTVTVTLQEKPDSLRQARHGGKSRGTLVDRDPPRSRM